jgi:hypothetical protein
MSGSTNFNSTDRAEHRKTALVVGAILALAAAWNIAKGRTAAAVLLTSMAVVLAAMGVFAPPAAARFHKVWMRTAFALGCVNTRILLSLTFFLVFLPIGLVARLAGRDRLMRRRAGRPSYWIQRRITRQTREGFERAF